LPSPFPFCQKVYATLTLSPKQRCLPAWAVRLMSAFQGLVMLEFMRRPISPRTLPRSCWQTSPVRRARGLAVEFVFIGQPAVSVPKLIRRAVTGPYAVLYSLKHIDSPFKYTKLSPPFSGYREFPTATRDSNRMEYLSTS